MLSDTNTLYLCNFDDKFHNLDHAVLNKLWSGKWSIDNTDLSKELLATSLEIDQLKTILKRYLEKDNTFDNILDLAISSFLTFCERNWNTHPEPLNLQDYFGTEWPSDVDATLKLQRDSEPVYVNIAHTELLYFSLQVFNALYAVELNLVHLWWYFRSLVVHQRALEDTSATLYSELELVMAKLSNEANGLQNRRLATLLHAEIAQAYLVYGRRTKWQQTTLPQLALTSSLDATVDRPSAEQSHGAAELPRDIELQDDVRLNKIQYLEEINELMHEELSPYIEAVVSQPVGPWAPRVAALLVRCQLEAGHKRSVERAMLQCEAIVNEKKDVAPTTSLGLVKAALEHYQRLMLWEDVILCYTMLQLRHKDAIRGAHRLLDIRHQFQDAAVLALLVRAVLHDKEDADGNTSASSIRNNVGGADGEVIHSERLEREMEDSEIRQHKRAPSNISSSSYDTDTSAESAVEETECHINNKFWYWLFVLGTALGDEIFYATFIPFWFWNIDGAVGRRIKKSLDFSRSDHMDIALSMLMSSSESEQSDNSFMLDNNVWINAK
ncbi:hypothetical protein MSG28_003118 [Choristoneura fumiferana]|uniref:Uncharacterized protein n=1 Tax=Choristoneura fumiferana TaxID=7141 RepID=A0ACC0KDG1_CHOFU|nr:hypothetical protein MSG28_003118 [Choristoneura fumiferana]